jgi:hypothetical protein
LASIPWNVIGASYEFTKVRHEKCAIRPSPVIVEPDGAPEIVGVDARPPPPPVAISKSSLLAVIGIGGGVIPASFHVVVMP